MLQLHASQQPNSEPETLQRDSVETARKNSREVLDLWEGDKLQSAYNISLCLTAAPHNFHKTQHEEKGL
jgi:hypothetical protein